MMLRSLLYLFTKKVTLNKKRYIMSEKKFSKKHEWVELNGDVATVGITKHATEMLGDIVFVEVPESGKKIDKDGQAAVVESTKAASDVFSDPEGASWFFKIKIKNQSDLDALMSKAEYDKFVEENPS